MRISYGFTAALLCSSTLVAAESPVRASAFAAPELTLEAAIERALSASPRLSSAQADIRSAEGEAEQAGYRLNPELNFEAENIGGTGPHRAFDGAVYTLSLSQELETGGKRGLRQSAANLQIDLQRRELATERLELIQEVTIAYTRLIATQEHLALAQEHTELAKRLLKEVQQRVQAARESQLQLSQSEIVLARARLAEEVHERELQHAKRVLASFWLGRHEPWRYANGPFFKATEPVSEDALEARLKQHPSVLLWQAEQKRQNAILKFEQAQAFPNPRVRLGVRQFEDTGDQALVVGLSVPIPVFNRNQGSVVRAKGQLVKTDSEGTNAWLELTNHGLQALEDMINAYRQARTLSESIIPSAERAFELARESYVSGRFPYLEVLEAQRTLFETKENYIAALGRYHVAKAKVEYVMATHLGDDLK